MKTKLKYLLILISISIFACKDEALIYSCDPVLNSIVTEHLQEYLQYTVEDFSTNDFTPYAVTALLQI